MNPSQSETLSKVEVLADLEADVVELMQSHEAKRVLWFPSELLAPEPDTDPDKYVSALRERALGISLPARVALCLNTLTEEGLPHFHRLISQYLGPDSIWSKWNNLWTAEEDRHGAILHDERDPQAPVLRIGRFAHRTVTPDERHAARRTGPEHGHLERHAAGRRARANSR